MTVYKKYTRERRGPSGPEENLVQEQEKEPCKEDQEQLDISAIASTGKSIKMMRKWRKRSGRLRREKQGTY